jgi:hypothetical protein
MGKKLLSVTVQGKEKKWSFNFYEDPKYIQEWRNDGLVIYEILNTVPVWVVDFGLLKPWVFFQDVFNFKNPFK